MEFLLDTIEIFFVEWYKIPDDSVMVVQLLTMLILFFAISGLLYVHREESGASEVIKSQGFYIIIISEVFVVGLCFILVALLPIILILSVIAIPSAIIKALIDKINKERQ